MNELDEILRLANCVETEELFEIADSFDIELSEDFVIESGIVGFTDDGIIIEGDERTLSLLEEYGLSVTETDCGCDEPQKENDMSSLIRKLDEIGIASRSEVRDVQDYRAKRLVLQKLMMGPQVTQDPQLRRQVIIQLAALDDAAKERGLELAEDDMSEMMIMGNSNEPSESTHIEESTDPEFLQVLRDIVDGNVKLNDVMLRPKTPAERNVKAHLKAIVNHRARELVRKKGWKFKDGENPMNPDAMDWMLRKVAREVIRDYTGVDMKNPYKPEIKEPELTEAEYHGRKVQLGKPFFTPDGPKKRSVYVKKPNGKVVKVNFGDKTMRIKKSNPARRKSFRARHHCENPGPKWKARYWSCRAW